MSAPSFLSSAIDGAARAADLLSAFEAMRDALPVVGSDIEPSTPEQRATLMELSRPLGALAQCALVVQDERQYARAARFGLAGRLGPMRYEAVIFEGKRFHLAQNCENQFGAEVAFIFPAVDAKEAVVDAVAWIPETDQFAASLGKIGTIGLWSIGTCWHAPPMVHESLLSWLLAKDDGLFILDPKLAGQELAGVTLAAANVSSALRLRSLLARHSSETPRILFPQQRERRRA